MDEAHSGSTSGPEKAGSHKKLLNELQEGPDEPEPNDRYSANEKEDDAFCQLFWEDMVANRERPGPARR
jgi:hypothetical protein